MSLAAFDVESVPESHRQFLEEEKITFPLEYELLAPFELEDRVIDKITIREPSFSDVDLAIFRDGSYGGIIDMIAGLSGVSPGIMDDHLEMEDLDILGNIIKSLVADNPVMSEMVKTPARKLQFPLSIPLSKPIFEGKLEITELELKKPKAKHVRHFPGDPGTEDFIRIVSSLSLLAPSVIKTMSYSDGIHIMGVVGKLLAPFRRTMPT